MSKFDSLPFRPADILLPQDCDLSLWSVVACDQYTSQPEYWQRVEQTVGDAPSALKLILPEQKLSDGHTEEHIAAINAEMERYLERDLFRALPDSLIYVERRLNNGALRRGIVGQIDLEDYDYNPGASTLIRATERTVLSRIPPRVAVRRGAAILGEVAGYGFSSNGEHISVPNVDGPRRSLLRCLADAGMQPEEIPYVNAHATSTPLGDYNEALAIDEVFGANKPYVASTKSMTGHEMWMAGASEIVYSMLMMEHGFIAPNINFAQGDEATSKLNIPARKVDLAFDRFLSNSFGFGGTNSTLIIKKCK